MRPTDIKVLDHRMGEGLIALIGERCRTISGAACIARLRSAAFRQAALIIVVALSLRLVFAGLTASTFDPDEFVILALGRALAHGESLYGTVTYFHPPGLLVLFAGLQGLIGWWWPSGRLLMMGLDCLTALFVWRMGTHLFGSRAGLLAGLVYAISPVALLSSVRIGPDPVITALGMLGLMVLVTQPSKTAPIVSGLCLALAVWSKYTAILYLPIYLMAAPSRARLLLLSSTGALMVLFAPFLQHASALYRETVVWQMSQRPHADFINRAASFGAFWLVFNPIAVIGVWKVKRPRWLRLGFALGIVFLITAQTYYHYFAPLVPFAALLSAPLVERISRPARRALAAGTLLAVTLWGLDVGYGTLPQRLFVSATQFSQLRRTASILDRRTTRNEAILSDEFEYPLLAHREATNYFWNMTSSISTKSLIHRLPGVGAVVETRGANGYPYPFVDYLNDNHYPSVETGHTIVWFTGKLKRDDDGDAT